MEYGDKWQAAPFAGSKSWDSREKLYSYEGLSGLEAEIILAHKEDKQSPDTITATVMADLAAGYDGGVSISALAKKFAMSRHTISGLLKGLGFSVKRGRPTKERQNDQNAEAGEDPA